jgi:hypothetical protein
MAGTATLEYKIREGRATTWTHDLASLSDSVQFANAIQPYTNAAIGRVGFTESAELTNAERDDEFADMHIYGAAFFRNEDGNLVKFVWPAPRADLFEVQASRHVLKKINGEALATILGMMTGHVLTFRHGGISTR